MRSISCRATPGKRTGTMSQHRSAISAGGRGVGRLRALLKPLWRRSPLMTLLPKRPLRIGSFLGWLGAKAVEVHDIRGFAQFDNCGLAKLSSGTERAHCQRACRPALHSAQLGECLTIVCVGLSPLRAEHVLACMF